MNSPEINPVTAPSASQSTGQPNANAVRRVEYDQSWLMSLMRPLLVIVMVGCVDVALSVFAMRFFVGVPATYAWGLLVLSIGAAGVAVVSTSILAQPARRLQRTAIYRLSELALLLALTRLVVWVTDTGFPSIEQMLIYPIDTLLDPLFFFSALIVAASWVIASELIGDLNQLALQPDELMMLQQRNDRYGDPMRAATTDRRALLRQVVSRWVVLGILVILLAAALRRNMSINGIFALLRQGIEPTVMVAVVVYFLTGLLLISQGQLALLRSRWTIERTPSDTAVMQRWPFQVLLLLAGIAGLAALMPFGGTFLLAEIIIGIINFVVSVVWSIYQALMLLFFWLASLFPASQPEMPPAVDAAPAASGLDQLQALPPVLPEWVRGALLWGVVMLIVLSAAIMYFRERGVRFTWLEWLLAMLRLRWQELVGFVKRQPFAVAWRRRNQTEATTRSRRWPWQRAHWDTPDQQVRFYYLSTLHDADQVGLARRRAETPLAYEPRLEQSVSTEQDAATAAQQLTDAFMEVRYAGVMPSKERVTSLHDIWQKLRRALREREVEGDGVTGDG